MARIMAPTVASLRHQVSTPHPSLICCPRDSRHAAGDTTLGGYRLPAGMWTVIFVGMATSITIFERKSLWHSTLSINYSQLYVRDVHIHGLIVLYGFIIRLCGPKISFYRPIHIGVEPVDRLSWMWNVINTTFSWAERDLLRNILNSNVHWPWQMLQKINVWE